MRIALAHRMSQRWLSAADLAHEVYATSYGADVTPRPDSFIGAWPAGPEEKEPLTPLACAGLTFGTDRELFSERYLDGGVEHEIATHLGAEADRRRIVEVGGLASRQRLAGQEIIRATPIIAWCLGMEYILCTVTRSLVASLERNGIGFQPFGPADPGRLEPQEARRWGTYYEHGPQVGVIPLNALDRLFSDATGRYSVTDFEMKITGMEMTTHASR